VDSAERGAKWPDDPQAFQLLDDYLRRLQAGEHPDREELLRHFPDLTRALECLEALESLAPPAGGDRADDGPAAPNEPAAELPRDFGPYELLEEIGRGGMGVVYRARQKSLDRTVAVKMILASYLASPEHVRRFQAEAKAAARLRHSHIVHVHEVGEVHGQHYFTMEYVEGESLARRFSRGPLDIEVTVRLTSDVARAVEHLHRQGVVHRDLKPSNILLDADGQPLVTDFGLAKVFAPGSEMTATGVIAGTPAYMSPEQAAGRNAEVGPASDLYSLGAILYELLTGRPPFREENPLDTLLQVLGSEPAAPRSLNPRIPRALELIVLRCLAKSPAERYPSAAALADDLDHFARGEALLVRPPHLGQRLWRWARRQPALASRLGALAIFYLVEWVNYDRGLVDRAFHVKVSMIIGVWTLASIVCQQFLESRRWSILAQFVWGTVDSALFLAVLLVGDGLASPLVVIYPLLVVGAGLWFRVRFVWFMTFLSLVSYAVLVADFYYRRVELQCLLVTHGDRHVIFALTLVLLGAVVSYLVQRLRDLSGYYGRRP
jgi:serine/threonine-protein kinase